MLNDIKRYGIKVVFTKQEIEIMNLLAKGYNPEQIADKLSRSKNTISTHLANVYYKLELNKYQKGKKYLFQAILLWLQLNDKLKDWTLEL